MEEYKLFWTNYTNFSGRSTIKQFWLPVLFNAVIAGILSYISVTLAGIFELIVLIPNIANAIRRMHDINKSGWWLFIALVPIVGWIIYLVFLFKGSVDEGNNYDSQIG
jgi:uncharacterized membrane protein YhaH (DUF805 family)